MAEANVVIGYTSDITGVQKGIRDIEALNAKLAKTIGTEFAGATQIMNTSVDNVTKRMLPITGRLKDQFPFLTQLPASAAKVAAQISTVTTTFKDANGESMKFVETQTKIGEQTVTTAGALKQAGEEAGKFHLNYLNLIGHALVTIPVWMALRGALMGLLSSFKDSVAGIIETDTALQRVKRSLTGTTEQISSQFDTIKAEAEKLSTASGISTDKIINSFQKFIQTGFSFETAMTGAQGATKLAVTTFSDAVAISDTLTGAFKTLVDTTGKNGSETEQLNSLFAQLNELSKTNKISMNEFGDALAKFAPVAKANNISLHDTVALLATLENAGLRGSTAGQLLRTSMSKLLDNLDKLAPTLGVKINPALDTTTSVLFKVIDAVSKLSQTTTKVSPDLTAALSDIFGGVRSSQAIQALVVLKDTLTKNMEVKASIKDLNDEYNKTKDILGNQIARYHVLNAETGKAFLSGILGAKDFDSAMGKLNATLEKLQANATNFGTIVKQAFLSPLTATGLTAVNTETEVDNAIAKINSQITKGLHFQLPLEEINKLLPVIKSAMMGQTDLGLGPKSLGVIYENFLKQQIGMTQADKNISALQSEMNAKASQQLTTEQTIANIVLKKKDFLKLEQNIRKELQATGMSEVDVEKQILAFQEASGEFLTKDIELQKELVSHMQALEEIELRRARAKGLVDNQLEYLKLQGATALQLVQERIELEKMYGINQDRNSLLRNELELNKEITKEKLNQNSLSSTSLKLFQVSKQYGSQTATTISDFLANKIPVGAFEAAGKFSSLMPVLEKFFSSELEQRQANQFFFKGQGTEIPIPERRASSEFQPMSLGNIKLPDIKTDIGGITVQIKKLFSDNETSKQIIDSMLAAIRGDTGIKSAIDEQIEKF